MTSQSMGMRIGEPVMGRLGLVRMPVRPITSCVGAKLGGEAYLRAVLADDDLLARIGDASDDLLRALERYREHPHHALERELRKLAGAARRYELGMTGRPTPFRRLAGTSVVHLDGGPEAVTRFDIHGESRVSTPVRPTRRQLSDRISLDETEIGSSRFLRSGLTAFRGGRL